MHSFRSLPVATLLSIGLAFLLAIASRGAEAQNPFVTFAFNPGVGIQTCSSGANTTPVSSSPNYLFRFASPDSGALNCSTDAGGWARFSNDTFRISYFYVYWPSGHFDFEGFDVRNNTGSPVEISVVSRDGSAQPRGSQTIVVPTGTSTVTLSPVQTYVRFSDIVVPSVAGLAFNNVRVRQWQPSPPGAPTIGVATAGNASAVVSFSAPSSNGGAAITGYTVTSSPGGLTGTCASSPCTVTGLTNGQPYSFVVQATNSAGSGDPSQPSNAVTPLSNNANLSAIVLSEGTLQPAFDPATLSYSATVGNQIASITLTAETADAGATMTLNGVGLGSGVPSSSLPLAVGANALSIITLAQNGVATRSYSVVVNREATVPDAPTGLSATPGDAEASITFVTPADGGSPILSYEYRVDSGAWTVSGASAAPILISGLTNGVSHRIALRAVNALGAGAESDEVVVTPATVPEAPRDLVATAGNAQASLQFGVPGDGGSAILDYEYRIDSGVWTATGASTGPIVISGLANGVSHRIALRAVNARGAGAASDEVSVTPRTLPDAPTGVTAVAGDGSAEVSFTPPLSDGGAAVTAFSVSSLPAGSSAECAESPCTVSGLTNGVGYRFTVAAINLAGTGPASSPSQEVTPVGPQSAFSVTASPATVPVGGTSALATSGGSGGGSVDFQITSGTDACTLDGSTLTGQAVGQCTVTATKNADAAHTPISATVEVTVVLAGQVIDFPELADRNLGDPAFEVSATGGASGLPVMFASSTPGICQTSGTNGATVTLLATGTCSIRARQDGNASYAPAIDVIRGFLVRPVPPGAPLGLAATPGNASIAVSWSAPAQDGGAAVTGYRATATGPDGASGACETAGTGCLVSGLVNGTAYTVSVVASNSAGAGLAASLSEPVMPFSAPAAPGNLRVSVNLAGVTLSWSAPEDSGGLGITRYTATVMPGGQTCTVTGAPPPTSCSIAGLQPGVNYSFTVVAENAAGAVGPPGALGGAVALPAAPVTVPNLSAAGVLVLLLSVALAGCVAVRGLRVP